MLKNPYEKATVNEKSSNKRAAAKYLMETIVLTIMVATMSGSLIQLLAWSPFTHKAQVSHFRDAPINC